MQDEYQVKVIDVFFGFQSPPFLGAGRRGIRCEEQKPPEDWGRKLARRKVSIRTPGIWTQLKQFYPDISPFSFIQLVKPAWVMGDRRLKDEERTLYAPFRDSDRESLRLAWVKPRSRRDGNEPEGDGEPESVKITPADPYCADMETPGLVRVETLRELFDNFINHSDPRMITSHCDKVRGSTSGALRTIPLLITGTYPIGRESDRLLDTTDDQPRQATLFTDEEPGSDRESRGFTGTRADALHDAIERLTPYPNDPVAKALGVSPRAWNNYKSGTRKPCQPMARRLIALSAHLPETLPTGNAERTELLNDFIRLQAEKSADAKSDASHATLQTTREIIRRKGMRQ